MYVGIFCTFNRSAHDGASLEADHKRQGKARQVYLYSTFHTQW